MSSTQVPRARREGIAGTITKPSGRKPEHVEHQVDAAVIARPRALRNPEQRQPGFAPAREGFRQAYTTIAARKGDGEMSRQGDRSGCWVDMLLAG